MDARSQGSGGGLLQGPDPGGGWLPSLFAAEPARSGEQMAKRGRLPAPLSARASRLESRGARALGRRLPRGHGRARMARAGHADNRVMPELPAEYSRTNLSSDPIYRYLRITKGGPGGVPGMSAEQDLVDSAWLQRLRRIHQLQSAWWVFATAEHSRFQHALGAMHLAGEWARHLYPSLKASCGDVPSSQLVEETMRMAGLLHDVGHGPFGHFFDENYLDEWSLDHEMIGRALVTGPLASLIAGLGAAPAADFEPGEAID